MSKEPTAPFRLTDALTPSEVRLIMAETKLTKQAVYSALKRGKAKHPAVMAGYRLAKASGRLDAARDLNSIPA